MASVFDVSQKSWEYGVGMSKGEEATGRPPWAPGALGPAPKAVLGVARPQGVERSRMAGRSDTLGSPWPPLAMRT
jgi:hypothetical protein